MDERIVEAALEVLLRYRQLGPILRDCLPGLGAKSSMAQVEVDVDVNVSAAAGNELGSILQPILSRIELDKSAPVNQVYFQPEPLGITSGMPTGFVGSAEVDPWGSLRVELAAWQIVMHWETQDKEAFLTTLFAILRRHLWAVPAGAHMPGVSLYESLRIASAMAACAAAEGSSSPKQGQAALVCRGDLSGIQRFIYRVTQPEAETEHVAKRLRGRSFYIALLMDVITDWLLRYIGMPAHNALFVGGGRFELLLPADSEGRVTEAFARLDGWLLKAFGGELAVQWALEGCTAVDLEDMRGSYTRLEDALEIRKNRKWLGQLQSTGFFETQPSGWHVCRICRLTPLSDPGVCDLCRQHEQIGRHLPHATHLVFCGNGGQLPVPEHRVISFSGSPFDTRVVVVSDERQVGDLQATGAIRRLIHLNSSEGLGPRGVASTFRFLANAAPLATERVSFQGLEPVEAGEVLHFEALADLNPGAKRLGVLKADVDRLGLVLGDGLAGTAPGQHASLARLASASSALDQFFSGYLNVLCETVSREWQAERLPDCPADNVFYVIYSGGDDLLVVGPWEAVLRLAGRLNAAFADYTGHNPNLTLSAGFVQVKPRYPVQKFAELVDNAEQAAKSAGRDRLTLFGQTVTWTQHSDSLDKLYGFAMDLQAAIETGEIPRGLLADLGEVERQHAPRLGQPRNVLWTPRLRYALARRLSPAARTKFWPEIFAFMREGRIAVPVSIVSLATRKE